MRTYDTDTIIALACQFSAVLREWLNPEQMTEVIRRNNDETLEDCCHSHDYCDANMAMAEAMAALGLPELCTTEESSEERQKLLSVVNAAWSVARRFDFSIT